MKKSVLYLILVLISTNLVLLLGESFGTIPLFRCFLYHIAFSFFIIAFYLIYFKGGEK